MAEQIAAAERAPARSKGILLSGVALAGAAGLLAATQPWVTLTLAPGAAAFSSLELSGQQVNASLTPLAVAALAAALALTIAGPILRRLLGVIVALLGIGIVAITLTAFSDWYSAVAGRLAEATGLSGDVQSELVTHFATTPYVVVAIAAGVVLGIAGLAITLMSGAWRSGGRKYQKSSDGSPSSRVASEDGNHDRISEWDELSVGHDPTRDEPGEESPESPSVR